ncbi:unnamed protein product [Clavelina lepadiformis]|uniref:G-protein coupled receptors family 1 profile domain-containing protein n=1 Tax=Clavelina lepadiformis TaxID=159417 RepID=A0ABP0FK11_CLALP
MRIIKLHSVFAILSTLSITSGSQTPSSFISGLDYFCVEVSCVRSNSSLNQNQTQNLYYVCINKVNLLSSRKESGRRNDSIEWIKSVDLKSISIVYNGNISAPRDNTEKLSTLLKRTYPNQTVINEDISKIFADSSCINYQSCPSVERKYSSEQMHKPAPRHDIITSIYAILWTLSLTAIGGNLAVIISRFADLYQCRSKDSSSDKVKKIHNITILNLAFADLMMGAYSMIGVVSTPIFLNQSSSKRKLAWVKSGLCKSLGLLNFASGQISISALILITSVRLYSVARPYKLANIKLIIGLIFGSWAFWSYVAHIPLLGSEVLREVFVEKIRVLYTDGVNTISQAYLKNMTNMVLKTIIQKHHLPVQGDFIMEESSWKESIWFARKVGLISKNSTVDFMGYFSQQTACTAKYLSSYYDKDYLFTMFIMFFNFFSFVYLVIAYGYIVHKSSTLATSAKFAQFLLCGKTASKNSQEPPLPVSEVENLKMQRKIFFIIITDLLCWIPICVISLSSIIFTSTMDECAARDFVNQNDHWFNYLVPLLTPINSSINPFLYSTGVWNFLRKKICT